MSKNIKNSFKKNTYMKYLRIKYKNKWDMLKIDCITWNKLKGSETELGWIVAKGKIAMID